MIDKCKRVGWPSEFQLLAALIPMKSGRGRLDIIVSLCSIVSRLARTLWLQVAHLADSFEEAGGGASSEQSVAASQLD